jgi:hypothetical protein
VAERQLLGIATHQVPGDADEREQQDADEDVDCEPVRHELRQQQQDHAQRGQRDQLPTAGVVDVLAH